MGVSRIAKEIIGICLILLLVTTIACNHTSTTATLQPPADFSAYNGNDFTIPYPKDWEVVPLEDAVLFHLIEYDAVTAFFLVMRADLPQEMNVEDYFELEKAYFPTEYTDYTPISTNTIILDGREAIEHIWSFTQPTEIPNVVFTWKYLRLYTIDKKVVWC